MSETYAIFLWLLKLGAVANLYFLLETGGRAGGATHLVLPAQILFAVSAYRCLFPVRYEDNIVFHDSAFSSIFVTRLLATFSEVAFISVLAQALRLLNLHQVGWVIALSRLMVVQVVVSQVLVWMAILTDRRELYFFEELGWALIFAANAIASAYLYATAVTPGGRHVLLVLNLLFGAVYLPWQGFHLRFLLANARAARDRAGSQPMLPRLATGLKRSIRERNPRRDAESWGGMIGLTWMTAYWATLIPMWVYYLVEVLGSR